MYESYQTYKVNHLRGVRKVMEHKATMDFYCEDDDDLYFLIFLVSFAQILSY